MTTHVKRIDPALPGDYQTYTKGQPITGPDSNGDIVQHHGDPALLALDGWMPIVAKPYNPDTHKQLAAQYTDDGTEAWPVAVELTVEELAQHLLDVATQRYAEFNARYEAEFDIIVSSKEPGKSVGGYTARQRETFFKQLNERREALSHPGSSQTFTEYYLYGMSYSNPGHTVTAESRAVVIDTTDDALAIYLGALLGKLHGLRDRINELVILGDLAGIRALVW